MARKLSKTGTKIIIGGAALVIALGIGLGVGLGETVGRNGSNGGSGGGNINPNGETISLNASNLVNDEEVNVGLSDNALIYTYTFAPINISDQAGKIATVTNIYDNFGHSDNPFVSTGTGSEDRTEIDYKFGDGNQPALKFAYPSKGVTFSESQKQGKLSEEELKDGYTLPTKTYNPSGDQFLSFTFVSGTSPSDPDGTAYGSLENVPTNVKIQGTMNGNELTLSVTDNIEIGSQYGSLFSGNDSAYNANDDLWSFGNSNDNSTFKLKDELEKLFLQHFDKSAINVKMDLIVE